MFINTDSRLSSINDARRRITAALAYWGADHHTQFPVNAPFVSLNPISFTDSAYDAGQRAVFGVMRDVDTAVISAFVGREVGRFSTRIMWVEAYGEANRKRILPATTLVGYMVFHGEHDLWKMVIGCTHTNTARERINPTTVISKCLDCKEETMIEPAD